MFVVHRYLALLYLFLLCGKPWPPIYSKRNSNRFRTNVFRAVTQYFFPFRGQGHVAKRGARRISCLSRTYDSCIDETHNTEADTPHH